MSDLRQSLDREIPRLRRFARALAPDRETADDLVQDALLQALRTADEPQRAPLRVRLFSEIVAADRIRRRGSRPRASDPAVPPPAGMAGALAGLSGDYREVLALVALEGLSYADCAEILGLPTDIVMSRLTRARGQLREAVEGVQPASGAAHLRIVK